MAIVNYTNPTFADIKGSPLLNWYSTGDSALISWEPRTWLFYCNAKNWYFLSGVWSDPPSSQGMFYIGAWWTPPTVLATKNYWNNTRYFTQITCEIPDAPVLGCTYPSATNYNTGATKDDQSCIFPDPTFECEDDMYCVPNDQQTVDEFCSVNWSWLTGEDTLPLCQIQQKSWTVLLTDVSLTQTEKEDIFNSFEWVIYGLLVLVFFVFLWIFVKKLLSSFWN